jgi:hypothetical protein
MHAHIRVGVPVSKQVKTESAPLPAAAAAIVNRPNLINLVNDDVLYHAQHCYGLTVRRLAKKTGIRRKP